MLSLGQRGRAADPVCLVIDEVAFLVEVAVEIGMDRDEFLQRFSFVGLRLIRRNRSIARSRRRNGRREF
jgi:hypothetical protein